MSGRWLAMIAAIALTACTPGGAGQSGRTLTALPDAWYPDFIELGSAIAIGRRCTGLTLNDDAQQALFEQYVEEFLALGYVNFDSAALLRNLDEPRVRASFAEYLAANGVERGDTAAVCGLGADEARSGTGVGKYLIVLNGAAASAS
ncbi:MAG: DUF5333 family protein [Pseudomonadota bacterium]